MMVLVSKSPVQFYSSCEGRIYSHTHLKARNLLARKTLISNRIIQLCGNFNNEKILSRASILPENVVSSKNEKLLLLKHSLDSLDTLPKGRSSSFQGSQNLIQHSIQKAVLDCRFFTLLGVTGTLAASLLCFLTGCCFIKESFTGYFQGIWKGIEFGQMILPLVEAIDVYLMGTVMLVLGMGLYELFISPSQGILTCGCRRSSLFGLFQLKERPGWLEIKSVGELKTKVGHVLMMILLVEVFDKSKRVAINTGLDLLCFSATILFSSASVFLLSKLSWK